MNMNLKRARKNVLSSLISKRVKSYVLMVAKDTEIHSFLQL